MDEPVTRDVLVDASPEEVWNALTDPGELAEWFGAEAEIDLRVGGAVRFRWPDGMERRGVVIEVDPPYRLTFRWRELRTAGASGSAVSDPSVVAFTVEADGRRTRVRVMESPGHLAADPPLAIVENA